VGPCGFKVGQSVFQTEGGGNGRLVTGNRREEKGKLEKRKGTETTDWKPWGRGFETRETAVSGMGVGGKVKKKFANAGCGKNGVGYYSRGRGGGGKTMVKFGKQCRRTLGGKKKNWKKPS